MLTQCHKANIIPKKKNIFKIHRYGCHISARVNLATSILELRYSSAPI